jgi:WD40 repeat protein
VLDEELSRLPEKYRAPLVLCYLQDRTNAEAARDLGWPLGSISKRLARGRELLRRRLARRGLTLAGGAVGVALAADASAAVPPALAGATLKAALSFVAGGAGAAPSSATVLAHGMLHTLAVARLKVLLTAVLGLALALGAGALAVRALAPPADEAKPGPVAVAPKPEAAPARADRHGDPLPLGAVARLGTVRWRNIGLSCCLLFSPDDRVLASVCWDSVILWDTATGRQLHRWPLAGGRVGGRAFTSEGKTLLLLDGSGTIGFWDVATGKRVRTLAPPGTGEAARYAYGPSISPDGSLLAVEDNSGKLLLVDAVSGRVVRILGSGPAGFGGATFAPDGKTVALLGSSQAVELWDVATGNLVRGIKRLPGSPVYELAFAPDGKTLAWGEDDRVVLADVSRGKVIGHLDAKGRPWSVSFTPDGKALVSGSAVGTVRVWDLTTRKVRARMDSPSSFASGVALSHDGKRVAQGFQDRNNICLWDIATGKELFAEYEGHSDAAYHLAFSPDGRALVTGDLGGQVRWWDASTWKPVRTCEAGGYGVALAAGGKRFASVEAFQRTLHVRDATKGAESCRVSYPEQEWPYAATFARDGKALVCLGVKHDPGAEPLPEYRLDVWNAADGKRLRQVPLPGFDLTALGAFHGGRSLVLTPDGRTVLLGDGSGIIRVCDLEEGKAVLTLAGHQNYADALALSADGKVLVSGSLDRSVRLWDLVSAREIATLRGHRRAVAAVAVSADGRLVASADGVRVRNDRGTPSHRYDEEGAPHRVLVWDAATGTEVAHFEGHATDVAALVFAPDGRRLVAGLCDSSVLVWDLTLVPPLSALELPPGGVAALWRDLAGSDAARANRAAWTLATSPDRALAFLKDHVRPTAPSDAQQLRRLITDLDSDQFEVRSAAAKELEDLGDQAAPALRRALAGQPSAEVRKRAEALLAGRWLVRSPEVLRRLRAIQVLERIGSPEARHVLEELAGGAPAARETREAREALQRLAGKRAPG